MTSVLARRILKRQGNGGQGPRRRPIALKKATFEALEQGNSRPGKEKAAAKAWLLASRARKPARQKRLRGRHLLPKNDADRLP